MLKWPGLVVLFVLGLATQAQAQTAQLYWLCRAATATQEPGYCPVSNANPLPTTAGGGSVSITGPLPTGGNTIGNVNLASGLPAGAQTIGNVNLTNEYPVGATVVTSTATNAASANNVNMPAVAAKFNYLCHFAVTGAGATAGSNITVTVNGVGAGFIAYKLVIPTGATVSVTPLIVEFKPCLKGNAVNTALTVNVPSFGAGNTDAAASLWGYTL